MWINSSDQINTSVNKVCVVPAGGSGSVSECIIVPSTAAALTPSSVYGAQI